MSDSIREQIIQKFMARAAVITVANGYQTDIGSDSLRAVNLVDPDACPAAAVSPQLETNARKHGLDVLTMNVKVEGLVRHGDADSSVVAEKILADLRKCFSDPEAKSAVFGSLIEDLFYAGGDVRPADAGVVTTGASAVFTVKYQTLTGNPYAQS